MTPAYLVRSAMSEDDSVTVFDGHSHLSLSKIGNAPPEYPSTSYHTRIVVSSGPFSATTEAYGQNYAAFLDAMRELNTKLSGEARLQFWNEAHSITFRGGGKGSLDITIEIKDGPFGGTLVVPMHLDQSYMTEIIKQIAQHFSES